MIISEWLLVLRLMDFLLSLFIDNMYVFFYIQCVYIFIYIFTFSVFTMSFLLFLCISTFEHGHSWCYTNGFIIISSVLGRGGNQWLSPPGCAMFSLHVRVPLQSELGRRLAYLQHIAALAVIEGVRTLPGCQVRGNNVAVVRLVDKLFLCEGFGTRHYVICEVYFHAHVFSSHSDITDTGQKGPAWSERHICYFLPHEPAICTNPYYITY